MTRFDVDPADFPTAADLADEPQHRCPRPDPETGVVDCVCHEWAEAEYFAAIQDESVAS